MSPFADAFRALDNRLLEQLDAFEPEVRPLVEYSLQHSGKKLRPLLVFLSGTTEDPTPTHPLLDAAAVVELVHLATLVHDDILDDATLRHSSETIVAKHGAHAAVLLGDALFAHALYLAAGFPTAEVCRAVSLATRQVCSGEIAQTFARNRSVPDPAQYFRIIDLKTAELFHVSAWLGAHLSGLSQAQAHAAGQFARHCGIAYQIFDDAADFFTTELHAGKTLRTDHDSGKITLPVIRWLESLPPAARRHQEARLCEQNFPFDELLAELRRPSVIGAVQADFYAYTEHALATIGQIPGSLRQQRFAEFVEFIRLSWNKLGLA